MKLSEKTQNKDKLATEDTGFIDRDKKMELKHVIVHKIDKEQHSIPSYSERDGVLDAGASLVNELIEGIRNVYKKVSNYGSFDNDTDNYPVQSWLKDYLEQQEKDSNVSQRKTKFVAFTKRLLSRIGKQMGNVGLATGGYFIFAEYSVNQREYFLIAMVKDKNGITITPKLEIKDITEIDLNKLHQAARINMDSFLAKEDSYLSFLKKNQGREVLHYFTEALGCTDYIESKISTDNTMKVVDCVCQEVGLVHSETREVRGKVYEYLKGKVGEPVTLTMISAQINPFLEDEKYHGLFIEKANSDDYRISTEFTPNATALRKYKKIYIKTGRWSLNFEKELLGSQNDDNNIVWDGEILSFRNISESDKDKLNTIVADNQ